MSVLHQLNWDSLWDAMNRARKQEESLPDSMHLLGQFRHRYENSHSDVLAALLRPNFRSPKSTEFLRLFLKQAGFEDIAVPQDGKGVQVLREHGRIDLLIKIHEAHIIIENKLDAADQPAQLARYYRFVHKDVPLQNIRMLYLSIDGKPPSDQSIGENGEDYAEELEAIENLKTMGQFKCISYKKDIYEWLRKIYADITKSNNFLETKGRLFSAVDQYLYNVEVITGQTKGDNIMQTELIKTLLEWQKDKEATDPSGLERLYQTMQEVLPTLKGYAICLGIFKELEQGAEKYKPVYFTNINGKCLQKIDTENLREILKESPSQCGSIGVGIPISEIPQLQPNKLEDTYIIYEQFMGERGQFGLAPGNSDKPKPYGIPSDTPFLTEFLKKEKYQTWDPHWYFKYTPPSEEIEVGLIVSWFTGLHNYLSKEA